MQRLRDYELLTDRFPLVVTTVPTRVDERTTIAYLEEFSRRVMELEKPFVHVLDARRLIGVPGAKERELIGAWMRREEARGARFNRGCAFVVSSSLVRGILVALTWVAPTRVPLSFHSDLERAIGWAERRFALDASDAA